MKIDPWSSSDVKDYGKLRDEFGIEPFSPLLSKMKDPMLTMRRGVVFGHRDFDRVVNAMNRKEKFVMLTGLMPSGRFHLGHKMVADEIIYLQEHGASTYLIVADIEAYNMRSKSLEELREIAINEYLVNYIALGLQPKNCDFYFQSERSSDARKSNAYYRLIGMASSRVTFSEMRAIYGEISPEKIMSVLTQVSDILHPELPEFEGRCPVVVPVGVDQDPHIRLSRDIASRMKGNGEYNFISPSSFYHLFLKGINGGKMSSSNESSYIALTDPPEEARKKVMRAFSGGGATLEEHRKKGGNPEVDVACQYLTFMFEPDDRKLSELITGFRKGDLTSGDIKGYLADKVESFLKEHQKKREVAKKRIENFLK
jgi:tryptophanyl-tRNA synthetase